MKNKSICLGHSNNKFYFALSQTDVNRINQIPDGCTIEVNLGNEIELLGGNKIVLSNDLVVDVVLINDKFVKRDNEKE